VSRAKASLDHRRIRSLIWLVLTLFVLLGYSLQSVAGTTYYSNEIQNYATVGSPPVILQNGTAGTSTIYTNSTSAKVSVAAPIWLNGWDKRVKITIDKNDVDSALSNFPVLVYLSNSSSGRNNEDVSFVFDEVGSNSKKIAVTTSDGTTQCYVEIEKWDSSSEQAWLWVKVPSVSNTSNTDLYLYYDNDHANNTAYVDDTNTGNSVNVWDSSFKMVQHMRDNTTSSIVDSTSNDNDGTKTAAGEPAVTTSGKISDAQDFDGSNDYIDTVSSSSEMGIDSSNTMTVSAWVNPDVNGDHQMFVIIQPSTGSGHATDQVFFIADNNGDLEIGQWGGGSYDHTFSGISVDIGVWQHFVITYDGSTYRAYKNGNYEDSWTRAKNLNNAYVAFIGSSTAYAVHYFEGIIDEVRISNTSRSAAWIKASNESGRDDLLDFGSEEKKIDYVDNNTSNEGSPTDKGTHSDFSAQQSGPDSIYDTLTEENVGSADGVGTETTIYATLYDATDEYSPGPELVFISDQVGYVFFQVSRTASLSYSKTTNGGTSWGTPVDMTGGFQYTYRSRSIWYDKWTPGDTGTKIHIIVDGYDNDDVDYYSLDTSDDSVTGPVLVHTGLGAYNAPNMAGMVTKSTVGYLFSVCADAGPNVYFDKSENGGSSWSSISPGYSFLNDGDDHAQLLPLADGDVLCIYFDGSAGTLYSFRWDEATDSWDSEGNVVTVLTGLNHIDYYNAWGAVQKDGEYDVYLAINNALNTAGADLVCYKYTASSNSWASQGNIYTDIGTANMDVKMGVDANKGDLYAVYSRGTWEATVDIYYKKSTDNGVNWGTETQVSSSTADDWRTMSTNFRSDERIYAVWFDDDVNYLFGNTVADISPNYELDLEVQWTSVDYDETNEELAIYAYEGNNTYSLDATGGYMIIGDGTPDWGSTTGTISFWIKWDTVANRPWGQHDNMEIRFSGLNMVIDWGVAGSVTSSTSFTADKWYFIAIVWDENTDDLYLYVGDQDNSPTEDTHLSVWTDTVSDEGVTGNNFMASKIGVEPTDGHGEELRYWNTDRTLAEIQSDYNTELTGSETNLRSYFKLNNNFDDVGPDNNDGSGSGGYSFSSDVPFLSGTPTENIRVDVWNGTTWQNLFTDLTNGWNYVSVSSYLTSSNFTIRFNGGNENGDTTQDSWYIDATLLNVWTSESTYDYVLQVVNQVEDNWTINLQVYESSNINRLLKTKISFHDGNSSDQIIVNYGAITQPKGSTYNLPGGVNSTIYISMSNLQATTTGTSYLYVHLKIQVPDTSTYMLYVITFEIT